MSEEKERLTKAYRRASLGLGAAALLWTAALLFISRDEPTNTVQHWLIPIGAAALSVLCWSLYTKAKNE
jgi:hypothetical protein